MFSGSWAQLRGTSSFRYSRTAEIAVHQMELKFLFKLPQRKPMKANRDPMRSEWSADPVKKTSFSTHARDQFIKKMCGISKPRHACWSPYNHLPLRL